MRDTSLSKHGIEFDVLSKQNEIYEARTYEGQNLFKDLLESVINDQ